MKSGIAAVVATVALGLGFGAFAQEQQPGQTQPGHTQPGQTQPGQTQPGRTQPGGMQPGQMGEMQQGQMRLAPEQMRHLAMADLYLMTAINNTKLLSHLADVPQAVDKKTISEAHRNIDESIGDAMQHLQRVRGMEKGAKRGATEREPVAGMETARIEEVERHLREARNATRRLKGATADNLATRVDEVATHLRAAQDSFRQVAQASNMTLIEDVEMGVRPVRGVEGQEGIEPEKGHEHKKKQQQPGGTGGAGY